MEVRIEPLLDKWEMLFKSFICSRRLFLKHMIYLYINSVSLIRFSGIWNRKQFVVSIYAALYSIYRSITLTRQASIILDFSGYESTIQKRDWR